MGKFQLGVMQQSYPCHVGGTLFVFFGGEKRKKEHMKWTSCIDISGEFDKLTWRVVPSHARK